MYCYTRYKPKAKRKYLWQVEKCFKNERRVEASNFIALLPQCINNNNNIEVVMKKGVDRLFCNRICTCFAPNLNNWIHFNRNKWSVLCLLNIADKLPHTAHFQSQKEWKRASKGMEQRFRLLMNISVDSMFHLLVYLYCYYNKHQYQSIISYKWA